MTSPTGGRNGKRQVFADTFTSSQKFSQPEFVRLAAVPKMWEKSMKILGVDGATEAESSNLIMVKYINLPRRHLSVSRLPMAKLSRDK